MKLSKLQKDFANHIYDESNTTIFNEIDFGDVTAQKRLNIYRNNVFGGFEEALKLTYKITKQIVGEDYFDYLSNKYIQNYKSNSGNLEDYGEYFPNFIEELKNEHKLDYLSDIAKLDWFYNLAYFSEECDDIDINKLQSLTEDEFMHLHFKIHPSCHFIESKYPIYHIYDSHNNTDKDVIIEDKEGEFILIDRSFKKLRLQKLSKIEFNFLSLIKKDKNIYEIYEILSKEKQDFDIGSFINKFVSSKILINFYTKNDKT